MSYCKAVEWLTPICEHLVKNGRFALPAISSARVMLQLQLGLHPENGVFKVDHNIGCFLLERAETDPGAYDLLTEICAANLLADWSLSEPLAIFTVGRLLGNERPKSENPKRDATWLENQYLLALLVSTARDFSIAPTRNEASSATSAADAMEQAFRQANCFTVSHERLRKLFSASRYKEMREELEKWNNAISDIPKDKIFNDYSVSEIFRRPKRD